MYDFKYLYRFSFSPDIIPRLKFEIFDISIMLTLFAERETFAILETSPYFTQKMVARMYRQSTYMK